MVTSMEEETLDVLAQNGGRLHYYLIAERLRISAHYGYVICEGLKRNGYVDFDRSRGICSLTKRGKGAIEKIWLFKLKRQRERAQEKIEENRKKVSEKVKTINY